MTDYTTYMAECLADHVSDLHKENAAVEVLRDFMRCIDKTGATDAGDYSQLKDVDEYLAGAAHQLSCLGKAIRELQRNDV